MILQIASGLITTQITFGLISSPASHLMNEYMATLK
jgi:hypothetical protein